VATTIPRPLRIGTRGSPLALAQSRLACAHLAAGDRSALAPGAVETVVIRTTGDRVLDRPLAEIGGKGLFTKEIDEALLAGSIDLAVHSVKDLPTALPAGIVLACVLPRGDVRDALLPSVRLPRPARIEDLPPAAVVGTASLRRQAQLLHRRPDLRVVSLRGNVATRLAKLDAGAFDATLLAAAGLARLGLEERVMALLAPDEMLPAVGQAAIGLACRAEDAPVRALLDAVNDPATLAAIEAERAMLAVLDGSCRTPIAGLARLDTAGTLELRGLIARPDGSAVIADVLRGSAGDAAAIGRTLGLILRDRASPGFFAP
jgi:hydroxymethylbilane synthase